MSLTVDHGYGNFGIANKRFVGQVVDNKDPLKLGRVRVRVPELWDVNIPDNHLPWSTIERSVHQGASDKAGYYGIPQTGSHVYVKFDNNDEHSPVITGEPLPSNLTPNEMDPSHYGVRDPSGNIFDVNNQTNDITITSSKGTVISISGSDGTITITTDNNIIMNCKNWHVSASDSFKVDTDSCTINASSISMSHK